MDNQSLNLEGIKKIIGRSLQNRTASAKNVFNVASFTVEHTKDDRETNKTNFENNFNNEHAKQIQQKDDYEQDNHR